MAPAAIGLAAVAYLLWSQVWRPSEAGLLWRALFYALSAWVCAFGITFWVYLATSLADSRKLLLTSLSSSAPAVWFSPATLLLSTLTPIGVALGLLLVANTGRSLVSRRPPQRRAAGRVAKRRDTPLELFRDLQVKPAFSSLETVPVFLGAFALQAGLWAILTGYVLLSAALFAGGAAIWTRSSIAKGVYRPREEANLKYAFLNLVLALILATALPAWQWGTIADTAGDFAISRLIPNTRATQRQAHESKTKLQAPKQSLSRIVSPKEHRGAPSKDGFPGLVLQDKAGSQPKIRRVQGHSSLSQPFTIPFTGEYHLFRTVSGQLPPHSMVKKGTPLDAVYITTNGGLMQMEAYQTFDPPIDLAGCGSIQLALFSGEVFPASASLQLVEGARMEDLGSDIFGLIASTEEALEYTVPASPHRPQVNAIRVVFHPNPTQRSQSMRVAIRRFVLMPRGL
jgi:hypothetical protein